MVNGKKESAEASGVPHRRRGRPAGKNRVPLSQEERRARNAQYERERRNEMAKVMSQLMETAGCDPSTSQTDLLATIISRIQRATRKKSSEDIADLERINASLEAQIATLQDRLGLDDDDASLELSDNQNDTNKRKRSKRPKSEYTQQEKRIKTQSETWSVDSGIEVRCHTSPPEPCFPDTMQNLTHSEQLPVETNEVQDHDVSTVNVDLQTELYNQIYNSESQNAVGTMPEWNLGTSTQSMSCMETLARSLILVPSIKSPQQNPSEMRLEVPTQPDSSNTQNESPYEIENQCDLLQDDNEQMTLGILTETEQQFLTDWIAEEYPDERQYYDDLQNQVTSYPIDEILSGFL